MALRRAIQYPRDGFFVEHTFPMKTGAFSAEYMLWVDPLFSVRFKLIENLKVKHQPFHSYTMKQAILERFFLDALSPRIASAIRLD